MWEPTLEILKDAIENLSPEEEKHLADAQVRYQKMRGEVDYTNEREVCKYYLVLLVWVKLMKDGWDAVPLEELKK